jgi:hypothetical protein
VQNLPEDLKGNGVLKLGIQTKYEHKTKVNKEEESVLAVAKAYFLSRNQPYEEVNDLTLKTEVERFGVSWNVLVYHNPKQETTMVYSILPELIEEESRSGVAEIIVNTNFQLGVGAFEMDMNDGEVRFRTSIAHKGHPINVTLFKNMFSMNIRTMSEFITDIANE